MKFSNTACWLGGALSTIAGMGVLHAQPAVSPLPEATAPEATAPEAKSAAPTPGTEEATPGTEEATPGTEEATVVTGSRMRTAAIDSPADVRIVDEFRLQLPGTNTVFDATTDISGVSLNLRQEGTSLADMEVRGLSTNATSGGNVLVLLDGIPQRRLSFGGPYLGALPFDAIVRTELAKGATAALYGRGALTGALQLFSDPGSHNVHTTVIADFETETQRKRTSARVSAPLGIGAGKGGTFSLTGSLIDTEGWQPRTQVNRGDVYLHAEIPLSRRDTLSVFGGYLNTDEYTAAPVLLDDDGKRLPGIDRDSNLAVVGLNRLQMREQRLGLRHEHRWLDQLSTRITLSSWTGDTDSAVGRPSERPVMGTVVDRLSRDSDSDEDHLFSEVEAFGAYQATPDFGGRFSVGASAEKLTYNLTQANVTTADLVESTSKFTGGIPIDYATGVEVPTSQWRYSDTTRRDTDEVVYGAFVRKQFSILQRVTLEGGLRYDHFERTQYAPETQEKASTDGSAFSPSAGVNVAVLKLADHRVHVFGNWGRGFSPVFRAVANTDFADVDPERSTSIDAGVKARLWGDRIDFTGTVYQLDRSDIVQIDPATGLNRNAGDWQIKGLEVDIRARIVPGLTVLTGFALRDPVVKTDVADPTAEGNQVGGVSKQTFTGGLDWLASFGLGAGTRVRYVGDRQGNNSNSFDLPAYVLWDAYVSYQPLSWLTASVYGRNLLDTEYMASVFNGVMRGSGFEGKVRTFGLNLRADL